MWKTIVRTWSPPKLGQRYYRLCHGSRLILMNCSMSLQFLDNSYTPWNELVGDLFKVCLPLVILWAKKQQKKGKRTRHSFRKIHAACFEGKSSPGMRPQGARSLKINSWVARSCGHTQHCLHLFGYQQKLPSLFVKVAITQTWSSPNVAQIMSLNFYWFFIIFKTKCKLLSLALNALL